MGYFAPSLTAAQVLAAITNDSTKWDGADLDAAISSVTNQSILQFWSSPATVVATTTSGTKSLNSVVIPNISSATINAAYIGLYVDSVYESSGATNYLAINSSVQVKESAAGSYTTGLTLIGDMMQVAANAYQPHGGLIIGNTNVAAEVAAVNKTYAFQALTVQSQGNNLELKGVCSVIILVVS